MSTSIEKQRFQPQNMAELEKYAATIAASIFAPKGFQNKPGDCMIAIAMGSEVGLAPLQSLQNIAVVNGKPSLFGDAVLALIRSSGLCDYFTETISEDGQTATAKTRRKGEQAEEVRTFSVEDAKKAQLWGKQGPWTQYPRRMLQMRARGFLARDVYPDCLKGLITREEAEDYPAQAQERPVQATVIKTEPTEPAQQIAPPALSIEAMREKTKKFCADKGIHITGDDLAAADTDEKLRELCRRKPAEKTKVECCDFTAKPQFAGSTIGSQNGAS
jgi:hypothetical protein